MRSESSSGPAAEMAAAPSGLNATARMSLVVAVPGEARDGLSAVDVPDADGAVAVTAARERARAVAGDARG